MQDPQIQSETPAGQDYIALPRRDHTILGVCETIGEDAGFNPLWLRIVLAAGVLYSPTYAIGAYFALGAAVLLSRLIFPRRAAPAVSAPHLAAEQDVAVPAPTPQLGAEKVPLAA